jgi:hypothetical protein
MLFSGGIPLLLAFIFVFLALGLACAPVCGRSCVVIADEPVAGKKRIRKWAGRLCYILALLALGGAVGLTNFGRQEVSAKRIQSRAFLQALQSALENYRSDNGEYPTPKHAQVSVEIEGHRYNAAGALMLYQALSGDGDDHILLAAVKSSASDGKISDGEMSHVLVKNMPKEWVRKIAEGCIFTDGFGHPFQYTAGGKDSVNEAYDLWSFGEALPPAKIDKAVKQDPDVSGRWIKNW